MDAHRFPEACDPESVYRICQRSGQGCYDARELGASLEEWNGAGDGVCCEDGGG